MKTIPIYVWQVRESVATAKNPNRWKEQDAFILATSAPEAAEIVGEHYLRRIESVSKLCPISESQTDKYRVGKAPKCKP